MREPQTRLTAQLRPARSARRWQTGLYGSNLDADGREAGWQMGGPAQEPWELGDDRHHSAPLSPLRSNWTTKMQPVGSVFYQDDPSDLPLYTGLPTGLYGPLSELQCGHEWLLPPFLILHPLIKFRLDFCTNVTSYVVLHSGAHLGIVCPPPRLRNAFQRRGIVDGRGETNIVWTPPLAAPESVHVQNPGKNTWRCFVGVKGQRKVKAIEIEWQNLASTQGLSFKSWNS